MAQKSIYEFAAKKLLAQELPTYFPNFNYHNKLAVVTLDTDLEKLVTNHPWLRTEKLAAKPDQLFGKRGKAGLLLLDADFNGLKAFINEKLGKEIVIGETEGVLERILVEPFVPHTKEYYVAFTSDRENDIIHFSFEGGIFVEENWDKVTHISVPIGSDIASFDLVSKLPDLGDLSDALIPFIKGLLQVYIDQDFAFLEINPFAITDDKVIVPLDLKARLDDTAAFRHPDTWGNPDHPIEFPRAFGQMLSKEEEFIRSIDEQTGASLKLTILNRDAPIWTMVAGGGASVIYTDTIADKGAAKELGNYGEYSGTQIVNILRCTRKQ
jgi:succinyl-CoA synthetase beta subunit